LTGDRARAGHGARGQAGRLVLLRHGRTRWNASGRFQGQADPPLDRIGVAQARRAGRALSWLRPGLIVTSDLYRARLTAEIVARACRASAPALLVDPGLRETALGAWEGLDPVQAQHRFPEEYDAWRAGIDVRRGGGETEREAGLRVADALLAVLDSRAWEGTVVAVSHGLALRGALTILSERGLATLTAQAPHLPNGGWIVLPVEHRSPERENLVAR
jgi:probable phosphoglycerate mutase